MPNPTLPLTLLLATIIFLSGHPNPPCAAARRRTTIQNICRNTTYPGLCIQYLKITPNSSTKTPKELAKSALIASLYRAQFTRIYLTKVANKIKGFRDREVVGDCLEELGDSVDSLVRSIWELSEMKRRRKRGACDVICHVGNIQTYLSSAVTDTSDCVEEFDEFVKRKNMGKVMATVKAKSFNVQQAATVALDLFCLFVANCQ